MGPFHPRASSLTEVQFLVSVAKRGQNATFCIYSRCGTDQHEGVIQPWGTVSVRGVFGPRKRGLQFATDNLTDCYGALRSKHGALRMGSAVGHGCTRLHTDMHKTPKPQNLAVGWRGPKLPPG
ncbi:hypothetical protein ACOMHN_029847 [Nucella lapillus]